MLNHRFYRPARSIMMLAACISLASACDFGDEDSGDQTTEVGDIDGSFSSITSLAFGPDNILFVGDTTEGTVVAIDVGAGENADVHYNLYEADGLVAAHLGVPVGTLSFPAVVTHPTTSEVFMAVTHTGSSETTSTVVKVTPSGEVSEIDASQGTTHTLTDPISPEVTFWGRVSARTYAITDMDYADGHLYVSGLTNADFASTVHKIPFPFDGTEATSSIGMYHAGHGQTETRAPILSQTIVELAGEKYLLAAYTCTPIVAIALSDIVDGQHVTGKTIGEMGSGNTPRDIMTTTAGGGFMGGEPSEVVVLTNRDRGTMVIQLSDIEAAIAEPGLTEPVSGTGGVPFQAIAAIDAATSAPQGESRLINIRHDDRTGRVDLVSVTAGVYWRISEVLGEYDFNQYQCDPDFAGPLQSTLAIGLEEGVDESKLITGRDCS